MHLQSKKAFFPSLFPVDTLEKSFFLEKGYRSVQEIHNLSTGTLHHIVYNTATAKGALYANPERGSSVHLA